MIPAGFFVVGRAEVDSLPGPDFVPLPGLFGSHF
jgi:hypothetical protein